MRKLMLGFEILFFSGLTIFFYWCAYSSRTMSECMFYLIGTVLGGFLIWAWAFIYQDWKKGVRYASR